MKKGVFSFLLKSTDTIVNPKTSSRYYSPLNMRYEVTRLVLKASYPFKYEKRRLVIWGP